MRKFVFTSIISLFFSLPAHAVFIGVDPGTGVVGADFPAGPLSFADGVVSYVPGSPLAPTTIIPEAALGVPDADLAALVTCGLGGPCPFVSLGLGGELIVEFIDNILTGSGDPSDDLFIFETGPLVQATSVDISADGAVWSSVGTVAGAFRGIDIDAFGFGPLDLFSFVRLTDLGDPEPGESAEVLGADIDAVGAISTIPRIAPVPEPTTLSLLGAALIGFGLIRRRRRTT